MTSRKEILATLSALRTYQWVKNLLVFVPLIMAHQVTQFGPWWQATCAFLSFSLFSSATYVVNDIFDRDADRKHPGKRFRPFAAGLIGVRAGVLLAVLLLAAGVVIAVTLPTAFVACVALYAVASCSYSWWLKRLPLVDVLVLSGFYCLRVLAGGFATGIAVSPWLLAFSMFFFLSLAYVKRYSELRLVLDGKYPPLLGRPYSVADMEPLRSIGPASGYIAVLVLALYINSKEVLVLYRHPIRLWLICPLLLYWLTRLWLLANRGQLIEDPVVFTARDLQSWCIGLAVLIALFAGS